MLLFWFIPEQIRNFCEKLVASAVACGPIAAVRETNLSIHPTEARETLRKQ